MNWFQTILTSSIGCKLIDPCGHLPGGQDYKVSRGHTSHWFIHLGSCSLRVATLKYYQRRFFICSVFTTDTRLLLSLQELHTSETTFFLRLIISTLQGYIGYERNNSGNHLLYLLVWFSNQLMSFTLIRIKNREWHKINLELITLFTKVHQIFTFFHFSQYSSSKDKT